MRIDNPAARLHSFLKNTQTSNFRLHTTRDVLRIFLNMPQAPDHRLYKGIGGLLSLPEDIHILLSENFPGRTWFHWKERVNECFSKINLNSFWSHAIDSVDERAMTELEMISALFETKGQIALIGQEEMNTFREKINELRDDVIKANLSENMRKVILHYLNKISEAIDSYQVTGVEPIMEAIESTIGRAALNEEYRNALSESGIGKKLGDIVSLIANSVTVAQGIPFLVTPLLTLLSGK